MNRRTSLITLTFAVMGICLLSIFSRSSPTPTAARPPTPRVVEVTRIVEVPTTPTLVPDTPTDPARSVQIEVTQTLTALPSSTIPLNLPPDTQKARALSVTDGDTIDVDIDGQTETIRYIGIDAPEDNSRIGKEAARANADLLVSEDVYLQRDTTERDQYGRLLRYVYLADGRMINQELVRAGQALSVAYPPDTAHQADFDAAQLQAQDDQVGMWKDLAWAAKIANIRSGPGTTYAIVDGAKPGEALDIAGRNDAGDWLKLGTGGWIFAELVANSPDNLAIVEAPVPPTATAEPQRVAAPTATPVPQRAAPPVAPAAPVAVCQCGGIDYDCGNFGSWSAAQSCFQYCLQAVGYDVHRLDQDNDGIVCESMR